ncbi:ricin-type beta-trefoil lectin domain protein [Streptomyces sp. TM32]|uniref:RICIN domain-containing protein n=1 Tax=Streptomyces sp. TM32 TaxID=1652669 RepID=UPI0020B14950|nr:ricin-type beta-trefoil lectin domain protein [Streptomyces sp. TM32]
MNISMLLQGRVARAAAIASATLALTVSGNAAGATTSSKLQHHGRLSNGTVYAYALQNQNTGRCVDDSFAYGLRAFGCNGLNYQRFNYYSQPDGSWVLQNQNTGRCVDDSFAYGLRAFGCNGLNYQKWRIIYQSDGSASYQNENTGRVIDDSSAYGLRAFGYNGLSYQRFYFR